MVNFMKVAINEAEINIECGGGGPFGAVVVKDGEIVGYGHNQVLAKHDPTCHGEVEAIRNACKNLGTHDLSGCILYTTAYPCKMCIGAIEWARISKVVYGCTLEDTANIGFDDLKFYESNPVELEQAEHGRCLKLFNDYVNSTDERY